MKAKNLILFALIFMLIGAGGMYWYYYNNKPEPVTITVPGSEGSTDTVYVEKIVTKKVKVPGDKEIVIDSLYKEEYDKAAKENDSLKQKLLYYDAITIREYDTTAIDNDTIKVDLYAKTRGSLLAYKVDYDIKSQEFTYTPEVVNIRPPITLLVGSEIIFPNDFVKPSVKFDAYIQNQNGNMFGGGIDTQGNYYLGYKHVISFRKKKNKTN